MLLSLFEENGMSSSRFLLDKNIPVEVREFLNSEWFFGGIRSERDY